MEAPSRYWTICHISLASERTGYAHRSVPLAQEFFQSQFSDSTAQTSLQAVLLSYFQAPQSPSVAESLVHRALAGLCLRCYLSHIILKACQKIDTLYSGDKLFTYRDLLPFVLNDEGKDLIMLGQDGKTPLTVDNSGNPYPTQFKPFSVEVLRTFKAESPASLSLDNWTFLKTKQHPELTHFLSEFGFRHLSDWALLNRARPKQLDQLAECDRLLVQAFHAVYRRDRRQQGMVGKCLDPTPRQLAEMHSLLERQGILIPAPPDVLPALKQVAQQLRHYDVWSYRTPLEVQNRDTGAYELRRDLPSPSRSELEVEEQEFLEFLHQQLATALTHAVEQAIPMQLVKLEKSRRYAPFAPCLIPGLRLYYCEGLSLKEIGPQLGMSSWDQTRRILNPGELLSHVRQLTVQHLLEPLLAKAQAKGFASIPPQPTYLKTLTEQVEVFVDAEIFEEAVSEIKAGKNRLMDSLYAQQLKQYVERNG